MESLIQRDAGKCCAYCGGRLRKGFEVFPRFSDDGFHVVSFHKKCVRQFRAALKPLMAVSV